MLTGLPECNNAFHHALRLQALHKRERPCLWVQLADKGIVVKALADVALHMAVMARRQVTQSCQQGGGAGGHKARRDHWVY